MNLELDLRVVQTLEEDKILDTFTQEIMLIIILMPFILAVSKSAIEMHPMDLVGGWSFN